MPLGLESASWFIYRNWKYWSPILLIKSVKLGSARPQKLGNIKFHDNAVPNCCRTLIMVCQWLASYSDSEYLLDSKGKLEVNSTTTICAVLKYTVQMLIISCLLLVVIIIDTVRYNFLTLFCMITHTFSMILMSTKLNNFSKWPPPKPILCI